MFKLQIDLRDTKYAKRLCMKWMLNKYSITQITWITNQVMTLADVNLAGTQEYELRLKL